MWNGAGSVTPGIDDLKELEDWTSERIFDDFTVSETFDPRSFEAVYRIALWRNDRLVAKGVFPRSIHRPLVRRILEDRAHQVRDAIQRDFSPRNWARALSPTRSFGCVPMLDLEAA